MAGLTQYKRYYKVTVYNGEGMNAIDLSGQNMRVYQCKVQQNGKTIMNSKIVVTHK